MAAPRALLVAALLALSGARAKRLTDRIYRQLPDADSFCFLRTNGTHQFGCTSGRDGDVGVLHLVEEAADVEWLLKKGPHAPYVAAFYPKTFSANSLKRLKESGKLSGAVLLADPDSPPPADGYSDDRACPNPVSSLYPDEEDSCDPSKRPWNPSGEALAFRSMDYPILLVRDNETVSQLVRECYNRFNRPIGDERRPREWPLCALELRSHMYAATDTETCLRRGSHTNLLSSAKFCDRMGDQNTFLFLRERNRTSAAKESVTVVAARMDSLTLFDGAEFGGDSPVTAIVALLETARLLAEQPPNFSGKTENILFALFHGEAFDYIGSSRFTYDLKEGQFPDKEDSEKFANGQQPPLDMDSVDLFLELGQLFNSESAGRVFLHADGQFGDRDALLDRLIRESGNRFEKASGSQLPPSSAQEFLKEAGRQKPAVVVSDFDRQYSNKYFHSIYDDASNLAYDHDRNRNRVVEEISKLSEDLARLLWRRADNGAPPNFSANQTLVNEFLKCYLDTASCPMFFAASNRRSPPFAGAPVPKSSPWPMYVGVDWRLQPHGVLTRNLLVYLTGEVDAEKREEDCKADKQQNVYEYVFLKGEAVPDWWEDNRTTCNASAECGFCYKTLSFRRAAVSPAFVIKDYNLSDARYSAWAESVWKTVETRMFLKASPVMEHWSLALGAALTALSFAVVFWAEKYSDVIFRPEEANAPSPPTSTSVFGPAAGSAESVQPVAI